MPLYYEPINGQTDVATTRTLLHEVIPLTGTIVSGTYGVFPDDENVKNYSHGMFQSVYDYPFLSSSANHIFDLSVGYDESSPRSGSASVQNKKKINMYNQMSQVLLGYTGSSNTVRLFESDLTLDASVGNVMKEVFFVNFSRLLSKDQIKKGSFSISLLTGAYASGVPTQTNAGILTYTDSTASPTQNTLNTVGGDYGILSNSVGGVGGVVFYQAGIAILTASAFSGSTPYTKPFYSADGINYGTIEELLTGSAISSSADAFRQRIADIQFNNTTEINSTVYFCRAPHNKFNYSANPTYLSASSIRVKNNVRTNPPISYITTIGLYSSNNELLAVAKLSEPLRKDPTNELTLRVRLDY